MRIIRPMTASSFLLKELLDRFCGLGIWLAMDSRKPVAGQAMNVREKYIDELF